MKLQEQVSSSKLISSNMNKERLIIATEIRNVCKLVHGSPRVNFQYNA
jgi:hypothetical protein